MKHPVKKPRGSGSELIGSYVPSAMAAKVKEAAKRSDLDKSKWLRLAMRNQLTREGI